MRGFLDGDATRALETAIGAVEARSAAEVVIAVRRTSGAWLHAHVIVGVVAMAVALAYMLFSAHAFSLLSILIDPFLVGGAVGAAVELWPGGQRLLTPARRRRAAVERAARAAFVERGVHHTRGRTGILVFLSLTERDAAVIADVTAATAWDAAARDRLRAALVAAIPGGGIAVAAAIAASGDDLAAALPRAHDDQNELPDAIDVSIKRRRRRPERPL